MQSQKLLFTPMKIKSVEIKNRIWVSPMCQYSCENGHLNQWHLVHLGSRAVGGAGLVMVEATAISPEGRISTEDSGIWADEHIASFKPVIEFLKLHGAVPAIQLAHAGRKAKTPEPAWAPSAIPFREGEPAPHEMSREDMHKVIRDFEAATERCLKAGFQVVELHMAHGYLMHEFLSPLSNQRKDVYGGALENRMRFPLEIAKAVRKIWPQELPLFARISATDWAPPGVKAWDIEESIVLSSRLRDFGFDLIDCSTGGTLPAAEIPVAPGYQVGFANAIRHGAQVLTAAVGLISEPIHAEAILVEGQADAIFLGREFLRNPYWPLHAAKTLGVPVPYPKQYERAWR